MSSSHPISPLGGPASSGARRRAAQSRAYRDEQARLAPYEQLALLILEHRAALGLTQVQLAERMGTSHSAVSRMESGRYPTRPETLRRVADALEVRFVLGFESGPAGNPVRQLVSFG